MRTLFDIIAILLSLILMGIAIYINVFIEFDLNIYIYEYLNISDLFKTVFNIPSLLFLVLFLAGMLFFAYGPVNTFRMVKYVVLNNPKIIGYQMRFLHPRLKKMSDDYYQYGVTGLSRDISIKKLPIAWRVIIQQLEIKLPIEDIRFIVQYEAAEHREKLLFYIKILDTLSNVSPSVGVLGTVLGLVKLLANLSDFTSIGTNMSLALMTTLYGIFFGTVIVKPFALRLKNSVSTIMWSYRQAIHWLTILENNKPSFYATQNYQTVRNKRKK